jgi:putative PIN family toxin of toxin-antitoxin system
MQPSTTSRVVIDTNVIISGFFFGGKPLRILKLVLLRKVVWLNSPETAAELADKLVKFTDDPELILEILEFTETFSVKILPELTVPVCRDPKDAKFLELALFGHAQYLISGDRDLLDLGVYKKIRILSPEDFLSLI